VSEAILNSPNLNILYMDERQFNATFHIFKRYDDLSFTDSSIVVMMKNAQISYLFSFDSDFDGINGIRRLPELIDMEYL
ncbi:MAG: PIN domain-containing protein, partial [Promethearchaeota archaeon]